MITINGKEFMLIQAPTSTCVPSGLPECHFFGKYGCEKRWSYCSPERGAKHPAVFVTPEEYAAFVAKRMKS